MTATFFEPPRRLPQSLGAAVQTAQPERAREG